MGRPLNKKYFGNRNVGQTGYATSDDFIGGEGVASATIDTVGSYTSALPTATFDAPAIPSGVTAIGTVHGKALSAVATAAGTGYNLADVLTQTTGGTGTYATWTVTGLTAVGITIQNGGTANDVGDEFTFDAAGFATPIRVRVTASTTGTATAVEIVSGGLWTAGALPGNTIGMTRTQVAAGQDFNGQNLQVNFTAWGVGSVAVASEGDYTAIASGAKATTVTPAGGTSATLTITYGVKSIEVTTAGSGYTNVADAAITFSSGAAAATAVLTTDQGGQYQGTGSLNVSTYNENAILIYANTADEGAALGDIVKQTNARSYKVATADGTAVCKLVADGTPAVNEAYINATDSAGGTYYVTKLTAHKALLTQNTGTQFETGESVKWTFGAATADSSVTIDNA